MSSSSRPLDIVIFGATGFTGAFVCLELARILSKSSSSTLSLFSSSSSTKPIKFGIAGRSQARLNDVLQRIRTEVPDYKENIEIISADVTNKDSLSICASKCKLIINCVGPFRFFGEPVVEACVNNSTHYIDVTGEPEFQERMELKYHDEAMKRQILIVPCCGFDSIPADIGCNFGVDTLRNASILPTQIESYFTITGGPKGFRGHYATWESAINGFGSAKDLSIVRKSYAQKYSILSLLPVYGTKPPRHNGMFWSKLMGKWSMPFMGSDASVVRRTQRTLFLDQTNHIPSSRSYQKTTSTNLSSSSSDSTVAYEPKYIDNIPPLVPIQYACYFTLKNTYFMLITLLCGSCIGILAKWRWGRKFLLQFPKLFTYGLFTHEGPSQEQMNATSFSMTIYARGYSKVLANEILSSPLYTNNRSSSKSNTVNNTSDSETSKLITKSKQNQQLPRPDTEAIVKVSGPEPGYVATPKILLSAAFSVLQDSSLLPFSGGVFTPGAAFRNTKIIERMRSLGIDFSIVQAPKSILTPSL